jgi:hypothetical protein
VNHIVRVGVEAGDDPLRVDGHRLGTLAATWATNTARARCIERGDAASRGAQETVIYAIRIDEVPSDPSSRGGQFWRLLQCD